MTDMSREEHARILFLVALKEKKRLRMSMTGAQVKKTRDAADAKLEDQRFNEAKAPK